MDPLAVWYCLGTEMPYPSSHTKNAIGTCCTAAALTVSQKCPSLVDASPIVQKQTSLPLSEREVKGNRDSTLRKIFDANAKPRDLGICAAVGAIPAARFRRLTRSRNSPFSSINGVAKCEFICLPAL